VVDARFRQVLCGRGLVEAELDQAGEELELRAEQERGRAPVVVERLDTEPIAREQQPPRAGVVDRDRPHTVEAGEALLAPFVVGLRHHLGVARACELAAERLQLCAQLAVVVDLAVEDKPPACAGRERLVAVLGQVDDRQPVVADDPARGTGAAEVGELAPPPGRTVA
jgi:hypothetical protein